MRSPAYTTQLGAGLGMIDETRLLLDLWQEGMRGEDLYQAALTSGRFPTLAARRLHDLGLTGWLWLLMLVFGWIFIIVIGIIPSQQGDNQYGKQPFAKNRS